MSSSLEQGLLCGDFPEAWQAARAVRGLKEGIAVKRYDGSIREFGPEDLSLVYHEGKYRFKFKRLSGFVGVDEYGSAWAFDEKGFKDDGE